jgi:hypothetical protein
MNYPPKLISVVCLTVLLAVMGLPAAEKIKAVAAEISLVPNGQQLNNLAGRGVALADFNGDGNLDAFVVNEDGPDGRGYKVFFGDGRGRFTDSISLTNPILSTSQPVVGDIQHDGILEVITGWTVWMNDGKGNFKADTTRFICPHDVTLNCLRLADLNGDGFPDIMCSVYTRQINELRVYFNDRHGRFIDSGQRLGQGQSIHYQVALADLNGDGTIDAVSTGWRNKPEDPCPNRIWMNDGKGTFTETDQILDEGMSDSHGLAVCDIDNDGDVDIIIGMHSTPYTRIYLNDGYGHFTRGQTLGSKFVEKVETGDLNGDGHADIFLACNGSNEIWLNDGKGNFTDSGLRLGSEWSWNASLGDLNNDGKLDIVVVNFAPEVSNGKYTFRGRLAEVWLNASSIPSGKKVR